MRALLPEWRKQTMTDHQRNQIITLRSKNISIAQIAKETGLSLGTVKSFLSRASAQKTPAAPSPFPKTVSNTCLQCGSTLLQIGHHKNKKFCSDRCRLQWWNTHKNLSLRDPSLQKTCLVCGKQFYSYSGKYCSRACYGTSRSLKACGRSV